MTGNEFYGWTHEQWALALAKVNMPLETIRDFIDAKKYYMNRYRSNPIEKGVVYTSKGDIRPRNYEAATKLELMIIEQMRY